MERPATRARFSKNEDVEKNESESDKNEYIFHIAKKYDEDQVAVIQQMTKNKSDLKGVKDMNTHKASLKGKKQHKTTTNLALKAKRNVNVNIVVRLPVQYCTSDVSLLGILGTQFQDDIVIFCLECI